MPRRSFYQRLPDTEREFLRRIKSRYGPRKSLASVLLNEMESAPEFEDRKRASSLFLMLGRRRGLARLERLVEELQRTVEDQTDEWRGPPERQMLDIILMAVGLMDTCRSHALLEKCLRDSTSHLVRADALEAMSPEHERFDARLILPFVSANVSTPELLSALYALENKSYVRDHPEEARKILVPLLNHEYSLTPYYVIGVLRGDPNNLDLIKSLADDPREIVREAVEEAIDYIEMSLRSNAERRP